MIAESSIYRLMLAKQNQPSAILENYAVATQLDPDWYKGWHIWALANFEVITYLENRKDVLTREAFATYIVPAVRGRCSVTL